MNRVTLHFLVADVETPVSATNPMPVNTELAAAVALSDAMANPTVPVVGGGLLLWNGATWDRALSNSGRLKTIREWLMDEATISGGGLTNLAAGATYTSPWVDMNALGMLGSTVGCAAWCSVSHAFTLSAELSEDGVSRVSSNSTSAVADVGRSVVVTQRYKYLRFTLLNSDSVARTYTIFRRAILGT